MRFTFTPMTEADAREILGWRYDEPYAVYNLANEEGVKAELLDPRSPHFAGRDELGELVGFISFGTSAEVENYSVAALYRDDDVKRQGVLSVGLGLRPNLTGQGKGVGLAFVNAGLDFARRQFHPKAFRLYVMSFNERAIRVYEHAGFHRTRTLHVHNIHGELDFVEMWRDA